MRTIWALAKWGWERTNCPDMSPWLWLFRPGPHWRTDELCWTSLRADNLHKLLGIILHKRLVSSLLLIDLSIYVKMSHEYFLCTLGYPKVFYLFCCMNLSSTGCWERFQFVPLHTPNNDFFFFWALPYFLARQDAPASFYIFSVSVLASVIFPGNCGSFHRRMVLKINIWIPGGLASR